MKCFVCDTELKFLNTPLMGAGNTSDGGTVCSKCFMKASKVTKSSKLKNYTKQELLDFLSTAEQSKKDNAATKDQFVELIQKLNPKAAKMREVGELPSILTDGENIEKVDTGILNEGKGSGHGLVVCTNLRVICIDKSMFGPMKVEDFPYDKITSVSVETGFLKGEIKIICSGNTSKINLVFGAKELSEFIRSKTLQKPAIQQSLATAQGVDVLTQIEKLGSLKEKGLITEQEFHEQKGKLLNKL